MDDDQSKRYESIDALIKAAEVLERNEFISKNKMSSNVTKGKQHMNICNNDICYQPSKRKWKYIKRRQQNENTKEQFSNSLIKTLEYIKELRHDERWYSLMENKLKSDNQALYQELNYLKKKLNKMKQVTIESKKYKSMEENALYENEDTSTASEDEDYNKYDYNRKILEDNVDDLTDDASECEEISHISQNTNVYRIKHISKRDKNHRLQNLVPENYSKKIELPLLMSRKRKYNPGICYSSDLLKIKSPLRYSSLGLSHSIRNNCNINSRKCPRTVSASKCGLIPNPECEVSSEGHRIA